MENVNLTNAINLLLAAKTIKGTSFVGLRNYENKQGEIKPNNYSGYYL
jgi:hypothetical protein